MSGFKVGDIVECVNDRNSALALTIGKMYAVLGADDDEDKNEKTSMVYVEDDSGGRRGYFCSRFKLHQPKQEKQLGDAAREAIEIITGARQDSYGAPEDSFGIVAQYWSTFLSVRFNCSVQLSPLDIANMMVLFKQGRKLGQKPSRDNYVDSIGYETIGADRLMGGEG